MADDDESSDGKSYKHRRDGDPDGQFVQTVRRFDAGLSVAWRWGIVVVMLIGFGITIQTFVSKSDTANLAANSKAEALAKSFDDFKLEIRGRLDSIGTDAHNASNEVRDLKGRVDQQDKSIGSMLEDNKIRDQRILNVQSWVEAQKQLPRR